MRAPVQLDLEDAIAGRKTRARKAPAALEFPVHCMVADTLDRWMDKNWRYTHLPLGEKRDKATAARLKRMGVKPGWPDFLFLGEGGTARLLELKRRGSGLSPAQKRFRDGCAVLGITYAVAGGYKEAVAILQAWGVLPAGIRVQ